jgi:hypothetical protein
MIHEPRVSVVKEDPFRRQGPDGIELLLEDRLARSEGADVRPADRGDQRVMGVGKAGQRSDLAGVIHRDLDDGPTVIGMDGEKGQGNADVVVEISPRRAGRSLFRENRGQPILRRGLPLIVTMIRSPTLRGATRPQRAARGRVVHQDQR